MYIDQEDYIELLMEAAIVTNPATVTARYWNHLDLMVALLRGDYDE